MTTPPGDEDALVHGASAGETQPTLLEEQDAALADIVDAPYDETEPMPLAYASGVDGFVPVDPDATPVPPPSSEPEETHPVPRLHHVDRDAAADDDATDPAVVDGAHIEAEAPPAPSSIATDIDPTLLAPQPIAGRAKRTGLVLLVCLFLVLAVAVAAGRAERAKGPTLPAASTSQHPASPEPTIPPEARTSVYTSKQESSGQYATATLTMTPTVKASKTNVYTVKVETSLKLDADAVARFVQATLDDPRGWASFGRNNFSLVPTDADGQLKIILASPATVDSLCGASETKGKWDCRIGDKIVLNSDRWFYMTPTYSALPDYRAFMVNRQIGFWLGQQATTCKSKGAKAPVMADQSQNLGGCVANPWPKTS